MTNDFERLTELLAEVRGMCITGEAKKIRQAAHFSLGDLATPIGVELSTVSRWERGLRIPKGEAALKYGQLLRTLQKSVAQRDRHAKTEKTPA